MVVSADTTTLPVDRSDGHDLLVGEKGEGSKGMVEMVPRTAEVHMAAMKEDEGWDMALLPTLLRDEGFVLHRG